MANLTNTLTEILTAATRNPGAAVRKKLRGGLVVAVLKDENSGRIKIELSRSSVWPSLGEWRTIRRHMPPGYELPASPRSRIRWRGRYYLMGDIRRTQPALLN